MLSRHHREGSQMSSSSATQLTLSGSYFSSHQTQRIAKPQHPQHCLHAWPYSVGLLYVLVWVEAVEAVEAEAVEAEAVAAEAVEAEAVEAEAVEAEAEAVEALTLFAFPMRKVCNLTSPSGPPMVDVALSALCVFFLWWTFIVATDQQQGINNYIWNWVSHHLSQDCCRYHTYISIHTYSWIDPGSILNRPWVDPGSTMTSCGAINYYIAKNEIILYKQLLYSFKMKSYRRNTKYILSKNDVILPSSDNII